MISQIPSNRDNNKSYDPDNMATVGIIGGTGAMGKGFAIRWSANHRIMIGSRDSARAADAALSYKKEADQTYQKDTDIAGGDNLTVAKNSDILILSIPYGNIDAICAEILPHVKTDCIVVSPIVPMEKTDVGFEFIPVRDNAKTSHESVATHMSRGRLISAFHVISEKKLANPDIALDYDIFVCGDDKDALDAVCSFISEINGLRPIKLGPGKLAYMAEIATPLLLNAMIRNKMRNPGIKLV